MSDLNKKIKEFNENIKGKRIAIIGLGVSNIPLLDYFNKYGAIVTVFDDKEQDKIDKTTFSKLKEYNMSYYFGKNSLVNLKGFDIIFRSPSCRPDKPEIIAEINRGAILTSEIELVLEMCPGKVIGITGSDGKTTTTSLIYEIIKQKGYKCYLGGNIGIPLFVELENMTSEDIVVLELSSFQLMNMKVSPQISVVTNIEPNHLDIHKSYDEYIQAKKLIFINQKEDGIVVLNYDNKITKAFDSEISSKVIYFSSKKQLENGVIYDNGVIKKCENGKSIDILKTNDIILRGIHNYENIAAAIAATSSLVDVETQKKAISNFKGVEHRLELVREINEIKWYNDSIGTSPSRTIAGLNAFDEKIVLIAGGYDKHLDYTPIAKPIVNNVSKLIVLGATAEKINTAVLNELKNQNKKLEIIKCETLEDAISVAHKVAEKGEIVLFSPASASFDMFKNFMERGEKFKQLVMSI